MILDGITYLVETPIDNAMTLLNYINAYMAENEIKGSAGELIQFKVNAMSPIWLIIFALGYMITIVQKMLVAVGSSFSLSACSNEQLLNLAQIKGTSLLSGTPTTIQATILAGATNASIPVSATYKDTYEDIELVFHPAYAIEIEAGKTGSVPLVCEVVGAYYVPGKSGVQFTPPIDEVQSMSVANSIPGTENETFDAMRLRLQSTAASENSLNSCAAALAQLTGVSRAGIYFNESNASPIVVGEYTVPARHSLVMIQGSNSAVAETYYRYLNVPTATPDGSIISTWRTSVGQALTVNYVQPSSKDVYVKVKIKEKVVASITESLLETLIELNGINGIGGSLTQNDVMSLLSSKSFSFTIIGVQISNNGIDWGDYVDCLQTQILVVNTNITVVSIS